MEPQSGRAEKDLAKYLAYISEFTDKKAEPQRDEATYQGPYC